MKTATKNLTKLQDYILFVESAIPADFCDSYLNEYENSDDWDQSLVSYTDTNNKTGKKTHGTRKSDNKICDHIMTSQPESIKQNKDVRESLDEQMFSYVSSVLYSYKQIFTNIRASSDTGYLLYRYKKSGKYGEHIDQYPGDPRELTCSFILNDDFDGGEFSFLKGKKIINPLKGSAIVFPSNFMFPHEVLPITKGIRYSMVTWFK